MGTDSWLGTQLETNKSCMVDVPKFDMNSLYNMFKHVRKPMFARERSNHKRKTGDSSIKILLALCGRRNWPRRDTGHRIVFSLPSLPQRERCGTLPIRSKPRTRTVSGEL